MWSKTILQIMAFNKNPDAKVGGYLAIPMDSKGLMEVDYIGTAVMMVKREVMESIKRPFDCQYNDDGVVEVGEDFSFCERAKEKGYRVWVHLDYVSNHYKEINLENIYNFLITNTTKKPKKVARAKK
jgi:GT2 family glycosyltransferase